MTYDVERHYWYMTSLQHQYNICAIFIIFNVSINVFIWWLIAGGWLIYCALVTSLRNHNRFTAEHVSRERAKLLGGAHQRMGSNGVVTSWVRLATFWVRTDMKITFYFLFLKIIFILRESLANPDFMVTCNMHFVCDGIEQQLYVALVCSPRTQSCIFLLWKRRRSSIVLSFI